MARAKGNMTQVERIVWYIRHFGYITPLQAMADLGVMRLASRIKDLKNLGYRVITDRIEVKDRFGNPCYVARYRIEDWND